MILYDIVTAIVVEYSDNASKWIELTLVTVMLQDYDYSVAQFPPHQKNSVNI